MGRYVQTYVQYWYDDAVLPSVLNTRGPLASLGVGRAPRARRRGGRGLAGPPVRSFDRRLGRRRAEVRAPDGHPDDRAACSCTRATASSSTGSRATLSSPPPSRAGRSFCRRAILRPSVATFLVAGLGMGALVLVRPSNQVLIVMAFLPLLLRAPWLKRLEWVAAFFVASAAVTQGWQRADDPALRRRCRAQAERRCARGSSRAAAAPPPRRMASSLAVGGDPTGGRRRVLVAVKGTSVQSPDRVRAARAAEPAEQRVLCSGRSRSTGSSRRTTVPRLVRWRKSSSASC